jgi:hypothetical protein
MTDNIIDSAIAELEKPVPAEETKVENEVAEETTAEPVKEEVAETTENLEQVENVPFPKKALNKISRLERERNKERAQNAALLAELEQLRQIRAQQPQNQSNNDGAPQEDQFENYGDYLEAKITHKLKVEQSAREQEQKNQQMSQQEQEWIARRENEIAEMAEAHKKIIPDFAQVVEEFADIADEFPPHVEQAFYEADDPSLAFYNLAQEGKLETLASLSPVRVAMEIARAQDKKPLVKRVTNAPQPISSAKGSATGTKSLENMGYDEIKAWLKS